MLSQCRRQWIAVEKHLVDVYPANTGHSPNAVSMSAHRLRRWPNIETALGKFPVFAGIYYCVCEVYGYFVFHITMLRVVVE